MAHDHKHLKADIYLYDKLFRKEKADGTVVMNVSIIPPFERTGLIRNTQILSEIQGIVKNKPEWSVNQYNTHLHKVLPVCKFLRHFKDYSYSQPDLPISKSLARDNYEKLWGVPRELRETHKFVGGLEQFSATEKLYRPNLMKITMKVTKDNPNASIKDLEKIIESKYPVEAELLLNYLKKYKHIID